jgi:hypothetical protein
VEVQQVLEVGSPLEGERACEELRAHGIKCDCTELAPPSSETSFILPGTVPTDQERLYVVVAVDDVERAKTVLQAWQP